jgi:3-oxo-5alpha-steroid 4-dehydrogenase
MGSGPFYAVKMSVDNKVSPLIALTMGGLNVNEESGAVIRSDGSDIPGLFAAGRAAVGACSTCFASGLAIADVVFSGRRAGRSVAGATQ